MQAIAFILASFPLANGIAEISQELVLLGPSGSLTHDCISVALRCSWPGKKEGGDSRSQIRAVESRENKREKSTVEIHHQTGFHPEGKAKHQRQWPKSWMCVPRPQVQDCTGEWGRGRWGHRVRAAGARPGGSDQAVAAAAAGRRDA